MISLISWPKRTRLAHGNYALIHLTVASQFNNTIISQYYQDYVLLDGYIPLKYNILFLYY